MYKEALVTTDTPLETVRNYLPSNYSAHKLGHIIYIMGEDVAGWTLSGYVIPRLSSGLIVARELV